ncbi:MAG TPA: hypothetical protein PK239_08760 [Chitinophagales bacterium]|nr:hypothetical protein [Chitinophagales bacterium]HRK27366.1 hypothetical protein [Chitinophagales bacterium]
MHLKAVMLLLLGWLSAITPIAHANENTYPQQVFTGVYLMNIYDINADAHSYYADFYLWFKWKGDIDPTNIEFVNMVEKWSATIEPFADTIEILENGYSYAGWRVEGRFYHPFQMERFPLDRHVFDVQIENQDYPTDSLVYLPDPENVTRQRPTLLVPGWNVGTCVIAPKTHHYLTDFGNTDIGQHAYSNAVVEVPLARPINYFLLKLMLPLVIVLLSSIGGLIIFPSRNYVDARISLPIGGLLTAVFLQLSYADALPDVGYMVLMDKIYLLAYTVIAAVVMEIILAANYLKHHKEANLKSLLKIERNLALFLIIGFIIGNLALIFQG